MSTFLECEVCMDIFNNTDRKPRVLPCGHSLCETCITKIIDTSDGRNLTCPFCQLSTNKGNSKTTVTDFPVLIKMMNMLECSKPKVPSSSLELATSPSSKEKIFGHLKNVSVNSYTSLKSVIEKISNLQRKFEIQSSGEDLELYLIVNEPKVGKGFMKVTKKRHIFIHSFQDFCPDIDNAITIPVGEDEPSSLATLWKKTNIEDLLKDNNIKVFLDLALEHHHYQFLGHVTIMFQCAGADANAIELLLLCLGVWGHTLKGSNFNTINSDHTTKTIKHEYYMKGGFLSNQKLGAMNNYSSSYILDYVGELRTIGSHTYGFEIVTSCDDNKTHGFP